MFGTHSDLTGSSRRSFNMFDPVMRDLDRYLSKIEIDEAVCERLEELYSEAHEELLAGWDMSEEGWEQDLEHEAMLEARCRLKREIEDSENEEYGRREELRRDWAAQIYAY